VKRYSYTTPNNKTISFISHTYGTAGACRLYNIKLEKGNKATDWSPAPEDVTAEAKAIADAIVIGGRNFARELGGGTYNPSRIYGTDQNNTQQVTISGKLWLKFIATGSFRITQIPVQTGETYTWSWDAFIPTGTATFN